MPAAPIAFALEFSSQGVPVPLLEQLAGQVLKYAGCADAPVEGLAAALEQATAGGGFGGAARCDVQLRARNGAVEILVSANGGRVWQTSCTIP